MNLYLEDVMVVGNYGPCNIWKEILKILNLIINIKVEKNLALIINTRVKLKYNQSLRLFQEWLHN